MHQMSPGVERAVGAARGWAERLGAGEVRLADNTGEYEVHLVPGEGTIDFKALFNRLESTGYTQHYSMAFGSDDEKLVARQRLAASGNLS